MECARVFFSVFAEGGKKKGKQKKGRKNIAGQIFENEKKKDEFFPPRFFFLSVAGAEAAPGLRLRLRLGRGRRRSCRGSCRCRLRSGGSGGAAAVRPSSPSPGRRRHRRKRCERAEEKRPHGVELRRGDVCQLDCHRARQLPDAVAELAVAGRAHGLEEAGDL